MATDLRTLLSDRLKKLVPVAANDRPTAERGHLRAEVLAVAASKGGVGKTTTAVHLAAALARFHGKKVLLADLDAQGHVAASFRSSRPENTAAVLSRTLSELLLNGQTHRRELMEAATPTATPMLDLIPSDKSLNETDSLMASKIGKEFLLRGVMAVTRTHYDFVVFDCPPNLSNLTLNALCAADHLLIPSDLTVLSLEGVGDLLAAAQTLNDRLGHHLNVLGILPTRVDRRNKAMNDVMEQSLADLYGNLVLKSEVPVNTAVNRAQLEGITLFEHDPAAKASVAYEALASEVLVKLGQAVRAAG